MPIRRLVMFAALATCACANPTKLARQSSVALAKGELRTAYEKARNGIEKDPQHIGARAAFAAAAQAVSMDYQARIVATAAATDTIPAADLAFEYRTFRRDVAAHATMLDSVPEYDIAEQAIIHGAARAHYQRGNAAMAARRPRLAITEFSRARRYVPDFEDVVARLAQARMEATVRVAVLPFVDRIGVPGLSQETADSTHRELAQRIAAELEFTRLIDQSEIDGRMTVAQLKNLRRDDAVALGRELNADLVVFGTYRGLSTKVSQKTNRMRIYQRFDRKDTSVIATTRWEEVTIPIVNRRRDVAMQIVFDVIEVETGNVVGAHETNVDAVARVAWTDFVADPPFDHYALLPPDVRRDEPKRAKEADEAWKAVMGTWELREFLRSSREQRGRSRYSPGQRREFYRNTRDRPVWLGELPSEQEMVFVAVRDTWRDVLSKLKELDRN